MAPSGAFGFEIRGTSDVWDQRYTSPAPWEHIDVSTYDGLNFALAVARNAQDASRGRAGIPERQYYAPLRKTYLTDPSMNPGMGAVGLDGQYRDYAKDDYYAWRHRGLRWSKTRRFPKSRWTKDWDHTRDKKLAHRPVSKFYDVEGPGTKESIQHYVARSTTGGFTAVERSRLLAESARVTSADIGPGEYLVEDAWKPKGVYCGVVKPSAIFESSTKRDVTLNPGFLTAEAGGGPRKPPPELYVSSEEERLRVQRQLHDLRLSSLGPPAPVWSAQRRGFSFPHDIRVTTSEEEGIKASRSSRCYVRIPVDRASRMDALARGVTAPAGIIMPTSTSPTHQPEPRTAGKETAEHVAAEGEWDGPFVLEQRQPQPIDVATAGALRPPTTLPRPCMPQPLTAPRGTHSTAPRRRPRPVPRGHTAATAHPLPTRVRPSRLSMQVRGRPPATSDGARSRDALELFRDAHAGTQALDAIPQAGPIRNQGASVDGGPSLSVGGGGSTVFPAGGSSIRSMQTSNTSSNAFFSTAMHKAMTHHKIQATGSKTKGRKPSLTKEARADGMGQDGMGPVPPSVVVEIPPRDPVDEAAEQREEVVVAAVEQPASSAPSSEAA